MPPILTKKQTLRPKKTTAKDVKETEVISREPKRVYYFVTYFWKRKDGSEGQSNAVIELSKALSRYNYELFLGKVKAVERKNNPNLINLVITFFHQIKNNA